MKTTDKIQIDFNEVEIKDLEGQSYKIDGLQKLIGNGLFTNADSIEISDIARYIHKGEAVQVNINELAQITYMLESKPPVKIWINTSIIAYLREKITELNNLNVKNNGTQKHKKIS